MTDVDEKNGRNCKQEEENLKLWWAHFSENRQRVKTVVNINGFVYFCIG